MNLSQEFNYGHCYTDRKKDSRILLGDRYQEDPYLQKNREIVNQLFEDLALPVPNQNGFFKGTHNQIAFVESHGFVVRVGKAEILDLINPLIIQPIGWINSSNITVAIYPGIEIAEQVYPANKYPEDESYHYHKGLAEFNHKQVAAGFHFEDKYRSNMGVIRTPDEQGKEEKDTLVILDPDFQMFTFTDELKKSRNTAIEENSKRFENKADMIAATIYDVFGDKEILQDNIRAFEKHQSLRREFWNACKGEGKPDKAKLETLWGRCQTVVDNPQQVTFPVWKKENDAYKCHELTVNSLVLHSNWKIKPTPIRPSFTIN